MKVFYKKNMVGHVSISNIVKRNNYVLRRVILRKVRYVLKHSGVLMVYDRDTIGVGPGRKVYLVKYYYRMHRNSNYIDSLVVGFFTVANIVNYIRNNTAWEKKYYNLPIDFSERRIK